MRALLIVAISLLITPARAQSPLISDIATDQELLAGYCLGRAMQAESRAILKATFRDEIEHFRAYLTARGYQGMRGPQAKNGVRLAISRGQTAESACGQHIEACVSKCDRASPRNIVQCTEKCRDESASCTAAKRCYDENALPF